MSKKLTPLGHQLTVVEERTSENGFKEDLDRKEF